MAGGVERRMRAARDMASKLALTALLALVSACTTDGTPSPEPQQDEVHTVADAGLPRASEEEPAAPAHVEPELSEEDLIRRDIAHLEALLAGELPDGIEPRTLFAVDLSDEEACTQRASALRRQLGAEPPPSEAPDAGVGDGGLDDGGVVDDEIDGGVGAPDAGVGAAPAGDDPDGGVSDGGVLDAGEPDGGVPEVVDTTERDALRHRRDALRLQFLQLPFVERQALLAALDADRELVRRAEEARATEAAAEEELRVAEAQRAEAAARAAEASSVAEQRQQSRRAEVASVRASVAEAMAVAAAARRVDAESERERVSRVHAIATQTHGELEPEVAEALYDELVTILVSTRHDLRETLAASPDTLPEVDPNPNDDTETATAVSAVRTSRAEAQETLDRLWWAHLEALANALHEGNELRLELLQHLPAAKRDSLLGFMSSEGRQQLRREIHQLDLMSRYGARHLVRSAPGWPAAVLTLAQEAQTRRDVLGLLVLLFGLVFAYRRRLGIVDAVEEWTAGKTESRRLKRLIYAWFARLRAAAGPLVLLAGAFVGFSLLLDIREASELLLVRTLVLAFLVYRLFVKLLGHELTRGPVRRFGRKQVRVKVPTARSDRIRVDVRRVGRFLLAAVVTLGAARWVVGKGTLYAQLVRAIVLAGFILLYVLLRRWRDEIAKRYVTTHPGGKMTAQLEDARGPKLDLLAFIVAIEMGVQRVLEFGRGLLLRFTAGRRAMAMLSRRRLEKTKGEEEADAADEAKPERRVATAFPLGAVDPAECLQRFPQLDTIADLVKRTRDGGRGAAVALIGEAGMGKTTWLRNLAAKVGGEPHMLEAPPAAYDRSIMCRWLSEKLGLPVTDSPQGLARAIVDADMRGLVCVDAGENLFLRRIGGTEGFRALAEIAGRTQDRLVWVCAFSENGWRYLRAAEAGQNLFSRLVELRGWGEEEVAELVESRMRRAGLALDFAGLLEGTGAQAELAGPARQRALERAREEYFRLLWDATDGNPRLVSHFWLRSLQRDEKSHELTVRLFDAPDGSTLDQLHDESRFLLAAVVVHEDLSAGEAAMVLRWPVARCAALLDTLAARGILSEDADRPGRFRIDVHYFRTVLRHLRRRRLLPPA